MLPSRGRSGESRRPTRGTGPVPDDPDDPRAFGADLSWFGKGAYRIVFAGEPGTPATHLVLEGMVFPRRPGGDPRAA